MKTMQVYTHRPDLNQVIDIHQSIFGAPRPTHRMRSVTVTVPLPAASNNLFSPNEVMPPYDLSYDEMLFHFQRAAISKRRERVHHSETWGNNRVEFIEWWSDVYEWEQVQVDEN